MSVYIDIKVDVSEVTRYLDDVQKRQLPFAFSHATHKTARQIIEAEKKEMMRAFDRPTPYTLNSLEILPKRPNKSMPSAKVWLKYFSGKGTPAEKYLMPEIAGGYRRHKRFESALLRAGIMPPGHYAVPGRSAQKDAYGNMSRGQIVQLLAYFRAFPEMGYRANMSDARRKRLQKSKKKTKKRRASRGFEYIYFARKEGRRLPGIYQKMTGGVNLKTIVRFVKQPNYSKRFDYYGVAEKVVKTNLKRNLEDSLAFALKTAR